MSQHPATTCPSLTECPTPEEGYGQECGYPMIKGRGLHPIRLDENRVVKSKMEDTGEIQAMQPTAKATTIPVPKVFEAGWFQKSGEWCDKRFCIVMEYIPGKPLNVIWKDLSEDQKTNICLQIDGYLAQLQKLTADRIMASDGGPLDVGLYQKRYLGPFDSVKEFHQALSKAEPHNLGDNHKIHFAHADLAPRNILVDEKTGKVNAVIDWERAGWYPEYWDYVRMSYDRSMKKEMGAYTVLWKSLSTRPYEDEWEAMRDLVLRTIPPYPDGVREEERPDTSPSSASYARELQKGHENDTELIN
ncbi:hypothetical protein McanCB56680_005060 [Microsporum canis]|uniref:Aminoglycoside phosphotransferase domain-containing protein n=1 Tax=Arthroderma otae (strain ATCC MYA-4605 / CBS 113480) TaxID=554155 RepID=C5FZZ7_ARTOC|nr:conserved hypothetical protein [Microsporum canis CBS 113480]EEQ35450.1 conserved hypothetical protein [Microsporum canis CBS 113480]